jgi:hypothetical protein
MVLLSDELIEWLQQNMRPKGSIGDASSDERAQRKGLGQCAGGERTGPTAAREGNARRMETGKEAGPLGQKPRQWGGQEIAAAVTSTTTRKGTQLRVYRVVPLLAVVVESEGH